MASNDEEIEQLKSDPYTLIVQYRDLIEIIVNKFIGTSCIHHTDKEEFIQIINEKLLSSAEKIKKQYQGTALLKTYFSAIIRNICLEEINKRKQSRFIEFETSAHNKLSDNIIGKDLLIYNEFNRFSKILEMYNTKKPKLELCLKVIFRLPVAISDFTKYSIKLKEDEINKIIRDVNPAKMIPESELFQIINPFFNQCENKMNRPDALRKWVKRKIDEIINIMNGDPPRSNYNKETIQILIEKFYSEKNEYKSPDQRSKLIKT